MTMFRASRATCRIMSAMSATEEMNDTVAVSVDALTAWPDATDDERRRRLPAHPDDMVRARRKLWHAAGAALESGLTVDEIRRVVEAGMVEVMGGYSWRNRTVVDRPSPAPAQRGSVGRHAA